MGSAGETGAYGSDRREPARKSSSHSKKTLRSSGSQSRLEDAFARVTEGFPACEVHCSGLSCSGWETLRCPRLQAGRPASLPPELLRGPSGSFQAAEVSAAARGVGKCPAGWVGACDLLPTKAGGRPVLPPTRPRVVAGVLPSWRTSALMMPAQRPAPEGACRQAAGFPK